MAIFNKSNKDESVSEPFVPDPAKAGSFLEHARKSASSSNYPYALILYAKGVRFDPGNMVAHEEMWGVALRHTNEKGKSASGKDVKSLDTSDSAGKFAAAEYEWMHDVRNAKLAFKTMDAAAAADQLEVGKWFAPKVLGILRQQKKLSKRDLVGLMDTFAAVDAWDEAMSVGEMARTLDPSDGDLDQRLKSLAAQRAMDQGGYNEAGGQEGGYRRMVKDADKQRELIEEDSISSNASTEERNLARAKAAYEENPASPDAVNRFAQLLRRQATPDSIKQAFELFRKAHADTNEYRFKMAADDIAIDQKQKKVEGLEKLVAENPDNAGAAEKLETARRDLLEGQSKAYTERVSRYPTDRFRKFDLGKVHFALGNYEDAMAQFQSAKDEPKLHVGAAHMLGRCFFAEGWHSEAVGEFDEAIDATDATMRDVELAVKYDLMVALVELAKVENDSEAARRAQTICSEIVRRDITYRDIRKRRKEVDEVIRSIEAS
ncbi:MAG: tetratricopeptide repeat protein [Phycisphaerales bacterium]